jgi:5-methylcytosine-specific restriction protein A
MTRREFSRRIKLKAWDRCGGKCESCKVKLVVGKYAYDHVLPDALQGEPTLENCEVICTVCHGAKTPDDVRRIRKADRQRAGHVGAKRPPKGVIPGSKASGWKKKMDGTVVRREQ